ncbi:MAG TPA: hypothetical protein VIF12_05990 [Micavibrio sp.]|jgi:hypothetical protein
MQIQIREFLDHAGIEESVYPGKRLLWKCPQPGEFKSHCVVIDWKDKSLCLEVKAGLSGRDLAPADLKKYPVSFQARTYVEIATGQDNEQDEGGEDESGGKSGGGGKQPRLKKLSESGGAFHRTVEGKIPETGEIKKLVILGKEIAREAYAQVMEKLAEQIRHMRIATTDLMAEAGKFITRYTPPAFMKAAGNEDAKYKYDRLKNETMFGGSTPS